MEPGPAQEAPHRMAPPESVIRVYNILMADNKKKIGHPDRDLLNKGETYEMAYATKKLKKGKVKSSKVKKAILKADTGKNRHKNRAKILKAAKKKLRG